ncbi:hypothetical protein [Amphritea sp. HPY]|uniref:hypothetical protein n=1 Tax=Amphritea sp. HPY TaxID=3421652 RepID=UPI003D7E1704
MSGSNVQVKGDLDNLIPQLNGTQVQSLSSFIKSIVDTEQPELLSDEEKQLLSSFRKSDDHARQTLLMLAKVHAG